MDRLSLISVCSRVGATILQEVAILLRYLLELWILGIESDVASMGLRILSNCLRVDLNLLKSGVIIAIAALSEVDKLLIGRSRLVLQALPHICVFNLIAYHGILYLKMVPVVLLVLHHHQLLQYHIFLSLLVMVDILCSISTSPCQLRLELGWRLGVCQDVMAFHRIVKGCTA